MRSNIRNIARELAFGAAIIAIMPTAALAQEPATDEAPVTPDVAATNPPAEQAREQGAQTGDIVVTGTLIRGIAPVGQNVIGVNQKQIEASGATTTNELLAKVPQVGYFGTIPAGPSPQAGANASNPISRPNLRNLPAAQTSGGAQTLVLIDGHRVVGAGTQQVGVDPDIIAPGAIQRVEALTDGGSAIYGSDALGGVINFITRRKFDGVEVNGRVGFANDLRSFDGYATVGKDWGSGGAYLSYNYAHHDAFYGADRGFIKRIDWNTGVPVGRNCANPNVTIRSGAVTTNYVPSGTSIVRGLSACDPSDDQSFYPESTLHNVYARFTQDMNDWLSFDMTALWARRETLVSGGTIGSGNLGAGTGSATLTAASPFYRPVTDPTDPNFGLNLPQTVQFNFEPVLGRRSNRQRTTLETFHVTPQLTMKLGSDWQVRAMASYGDALVTYKNRTLNPTTFGAAVATNQLNPFDLTAASPTVLAGLFGFNRGFGDNELFDYRVIADGPLFRLPGGEIKVAVGAEYMKDNFERQISNERNLTLLPAVEYTQSVKSIFGETQIPIFSQENALPGIQELTLSGSIRYDKYNDFGSTTNPKLAVNYKPVEWITLKGNWGKNFTAPSPVDQLGVFTAAASLVPSAFLVPPPGETFAPGEQGVFMGSGTAPGLKPQTARQWSVGATVEPPVIPGLTLNASYYVINLKGTIGRPVGVNIIPFYQNFPDLFAFRPTGAVLSQFLTNINPSNVGFTICNPTDAVNQAQIVNPGQSCAGATQPVGIVLDTLVRNLGETKLTGIDFGASYARDTGFGSIDASLVGNRRLKQDARPSPISPLIDELATENPKLRMQATLGADIGNFRAQAAWNHVSGYKRAGGASLATNFGQGRVDAFDTFDLFFKYDVNGTGLMQDLSFTLNVQNVLDTDPPRIKSTSSSAPGFDPTLAFTLGRYVQFGVRKKF
jgi:iron complex outermembrane recepter protein